MPSLKSSVDKFVSSAETFCAEPNLPNAVNYWARQRQAALLAKDLGLPPWDTIRALVVDRHGTKALAAISKSARLYPSFLRTTSGATSAGHGDCGLPRPARTARQR